MCSNAHGWWRNKKPDHSGPAVRARPPWRGHKILFFENFCFTRRFERTNYFKRNLFAMIVKAHSIWAAPTIYGLYQQTGDEGVDFQPMVAGDKLINTLDRIAQYYRIYQHHISRGVFLGIEFRIHDLVFPDIGGGPDDVSWIHVGDFER